MLSCFYKREVKMNEKGRFGLSLSKAIDVLEQGFGIFVRDLKAGDVVTLVTNNTYWLVFTDSEGNVILSSNGPHVKKPMLSQVIGATLGGSDLKWAWILLGYPLELKEKKLTRVRSISLNGKKMMPLQKGIQ